MQGDAVVAGAEDGVHPLDARDGGAPGARRALVAGGDAGVPEVAAPGALQQVAADGGHAAQLDRGAEQQRLPHEGQPVPYDGVGGELRHGRQRADADRRVVVDDAAEGEPGDVDEPFGAEDTVLHEVQLRGAAGKERGARIAADQGHGLAGVGGAGVGEGAHRHLSASTSWIAARMWG